MDMKTGKTYESLEAAKADGVPESRLVSSDPAYWQRFQNAKYPEPHQGARERVRRAKRLATAP